MSKKPTDNPEEQTLENKPSNTEDVPDSRPDEYALPHDNRKNRGNLSDTASSSASATDDADDFIYARYKRRSSSHHNHSHKETSEEDFALAVPPKKRFHPDSSGKKVTKSSRASSEESVSEEDFALAVPPKKRFHPGHHGETNSEISSQEGTSLSSSAETSHTAEKEKTSVFEKDDTPVVISTRGRHYHKREEKKEEGFGDSPVISKTEQHKNYKDKKKKPWWKKLLLILGIIFGAILGLLLILAIVLVIMYFIGQSQLTDYSNINMTAPVIEGANIEIEDSGKRVTYKGKEYAFNQDLTSILCLGVDKRGLGLDYGVVGTGGQADALYLIAFNTKTGETDIIAIPRDTMADIEIYSPEGEYMRTDNYQICLAYAYGDGKESSCENTKTAVERLFYGLPIQSYFAMDIEAITYLNDAVGGVTVTIANDTFVDSNEVRHYAGETYTLYGKDVDRYLRMRDITVLESTTDRVDRQISYLKAFTAKVIEMTKKDLGVPLNLMNIVSDNSVTNLNPPKITAFATTIVTNGVNGASFKKVPGELTSDGTYAQYIVDETALYEMILDVYYNPVS